jgi:hypothetical protein
LDTKRKLQALAAAAFSLPGLALPAFADAGDTPDSVPPPTMINDSQTDSGSDFEFGYRFHRYSEDALGPIQTGNFNGDSTDRYEIRANQFNLAAQVNDSLSLNVAYQHENMAGASPWFTLKNAAGKVTQVMTGASISDSRKDIQVSGAYEHENLIYGLSAAASDEDDYDSLSFGASFAVDFDQRLSTFALSADFSNDDVEPSDSDEFTNRIISAGKHSSSVLASFSRVINKNSLLQLSFGYTTQSGFLSDPYKQVFVDFSLQNDHRPDSRINRTYSARYRYYVDATDGAFRADYRYYRDSWEIKSHTLDLSFDQPLGWGIRLIPAVRYYHQDASFFYQHFYETARADGFQSTDYRLSAYGAETYSLTLQKAFKSFTLHLKAQTYRSGRNKGFARHEEANPSLLDFDLISVGFDYRF